MKPYEYTEAADGENLRIEPGPHGGAWLIVQNYGASRIIEVDPSAVPAAALALYEAAGLPAPVILPRVMHPLSGPWRLSEGSTLTASCYGKQVRIAFDQVNGPASAFPPAEARELAAVLVALADQAEAEPDPAEVEELAEAIRAAIHPDAPRLGLRPTDSDRIAARTALQWKREAGSAR